MEHSDSEDETELSSEQMEKLVQLQDLTGIEDTEICRALLESKDWDLETVAREHLGIPDQMEPNNELDLHPNIEADEVQAAHIQPVWHEVLAPPIQPVWQVPHSITTWVIHILSLPARILSGGLSGVWNFVTNLFDLPPRLTSGVRDPLGDVNSFYSDFESRYGSVHPPFYRGSYSQVLEEAKKDLKFLMVYLHCEDHQDTDLYCSTVLSNRQLSEYVTGQSMLFWGCSVRRAEGMRVSHALRENSYPAVVLIVLRQNRMVVVGRKEGGDITSTELNDWLRETVTEYEAFIVAARVERDERNLDRVIRDEQETAYAETLRQDQEREQRKQEEENRLREQQNKEQKEEEERERQRKEELDKKTEIRKLKIDLASEIAEEPPIEYEESVRVLIKLPGGQRLERRFLASQSLKQIFYFVFCHPDSPDEFDIVTNYPKRRLHCKPTPGEPDPPTLKESGFSRSEMLFVNDLDS